MADSSEGADGQEARRARKRARWDTAPDAAQPNGANGAPAAAQPLAASATAAAGATAGALEKASQLKAPSSLGDIKARLAALKAAKAAKQAATAGGAVAPSAAAAAPSGAIPSDAAAQAIQPPAASAAAAAAMPPPPPRPAAQRPAPLRLDAEGREIDEFGNPIVRPEATTSTLKVNQRKPGFVPPPEPPKVDAASFEDPELYMRRSERRKRGSFDFVKEGKLQKQAQIGRLRAEYGDEAVKQLRQREAEERRAARAAREQGTIDVNQIPLGEKPKEAEAARPPLEPIPDIEWWDARICVDGASYDSMAAADAEDEFLLRDKITNLVQHPVPIEPPAEAPEPAPRPLMLTKKEMRKLRKQRREEREKEKQDLIRQGLLEPPPPKVKISNLMRVLGEEATMDPTAIEQQVRQQMEERSQAHEDRNEARKLTPSERREKKLAKLIGEAGPDTLVAVYRVESLAKPQLRYKVDVNAVENHLTGAAIITDEFCIVVVEGGAKGQKRYSKLMLRRIQWGAEDEDEDARPATAARKGPNSCALVWEGSVKQPAFQRFSVEMCRTAAAAQSLLAERGVGHYWDVAALAAPGEE